MRKQIVLAFTGLFSGLIIWELYKMTTPFKIPTGVTPQHPDGKSYNNPGNILENNTVDYMGEDPATNGYSNFKTLAYGYRALTMLAKSYYKNGFTTPKLFFGRYDSSNAAYPQSIATLLGITVDTDLFDHINGYLLPSFLAAIAQEEQGWVSKPDTLQTATILEVYQTYFT